MPPITILVTGATGMVGRHLLPRLAGANVHAVSSIDADLTSSVAVRDLLARVRPEAIIHLAAYSGGIGANRKYPADFYYRNIMMQALMFEVAARNGVRRLLYFMGGCSYPAHAASPIAETAMWEGFPQPESASYSSTKKLGIVAGQAYAQQYGLSSTVLVPGNLYGEYDNFSLEDSHVIPAMIRKFITARRDAAPQVVLWGSGQPTRDFVYAGDLAALIPKFVEEIIDPGPLNVSSGTEFSMRELAAMIAELCGYEGGVIWDSSKPDGQMRKVFSTARLNGLGLTCATPLRDGLSRTIEWFERNYASAGEGLRL